MAKEFVQLGKKCKIGEGRCYRGRLVGLILFKLKSKELYGSRFLIQEIVLQAGLRVKIN